MVELDDPDAVRGAASAVNSSCGTVQGSMASVAQGWSPIQQQYDAPEGPMAAQAMQTPQQHATELSEAGSSAHSALEIYASELETLHSQRNSLLADIADFEADGAEGADDDDWEAREEAIDELQQRCHSLAQQKDQAQNTCASTLDGITTSASAFRGSQHAPETANEADDVTGAPRGVVKDTVSFVGLYPGDDLDSDAANLGVFGVSTAIAGAGIGVDNRLGNLSRQAPRQNWAPRWTQRIAGSGNGARAATVAAVTGWDARTVTNGGQYLGKNDARNPYRSSGSGAGNALRNVRNQTFANLNSNNRTPTSGNSGAHRVWSGASRALTIGGGALTAGTSAVSSWQEDSANHPDMSKTEKGARAGTTAATTAGGAFAGGKAGAAVGAAVGSVFPGVGTAVGGVVGGIIGGAVGGLAGSAVGDTLKGAVGSAAESVKDVASDAWDGVTSFFGD